MRPAQDSLPRELVQRLRELRSVGVITGAGVSAESGIRTYRGRGGLYDDPARGDETVEALSAPTLLRDPDRTWRALARLAEQAAGARPNRAHRALAAIERKTDRFVLLTQNVDGLHETAGSRNVIEIHGTVRSARCRSCGRRRSVDIDELAALTSGPRCSRCGAVLRPDAVLFGELLPEREVERLHEELIVDPPDLLIVAGTTAMFPYVVEPVEVALRAGSLTVEINPERTPLSSAVRHVLTGTAGRWLPLLEHGLAARIRPGRRPRDPFGRVLPRGSPDGMWWREEPTSARLTLCQAIERGADLFDSRRFFEAHEWLELAWKELAPDRDRPLWRAATQLAAGCCNLQRGNTKGARAVLVRARGGLRGPTAELAGRLIDALDRGRPTRFEPLPRADLLP